MLTVVIAVPLGTLAALGLRFGRVPGRRFVIAVVLAPVVAPSVITGLAMYLAFAQVGLTSTMTGLVVAHVVLCAPYGFTAVLAGLQGFDASLLLAARGLGASPAGAVRRVLLPMVAPAVGAGAVFAFAISFDELVITMFLAGPEQRTLPRQMYAGLRDTISPALAAAAVLLAGASIGGGEAAVRPSGPWLRPPALPAADYEEGGRRCGEGRKGGGFGDGSLIGEG